jgi:basic membrane protein A
MINICCVALVLVLSAGGVASAGDTTSLTGNITAAQLSNDNYLPIALRNFPLSVGYVTDLAGIDDNGFNATAWAGVERAIAELGVVGNYLESSHSSQFEPNLRQFASQDYGLTIAAGWMLGEALANVAAQYPNSMFTIVDYYYPDHAHDECIPNVQSQIFRVDQAAFLAGYLAAGMTETGVIGWFGGIQIPTVTIFAVGYQKGMEHYNSVHTDNVQLIGWDSATGDGLFTGDFHDKTKGKEATESLFDEGADIFMPVGGLIGEKGFDVARQRGGLGIFIDLDGYYFLPQHQDVMLTSVMKNMDNSVYDVIEAAMNGNFDGCGVYRGDLDNEGVGIAPYHSLAGAVPLWLKTEVETLKADIISGIISNTGCVSYPWHCPAGMYP